MAQPSVTPHWASSGASGGHPPNTDKSGHSATPPSVFLYFGEIFRGFATVTTRDAIYDHAWRVARQAILDGPKGRICAIKGPKCVRHATEVDHIIPVADGGPRLDPANLRPACKPCNIGRANTEKHREGWRRSSTVIILVVGPAGAGKSTQVQGQAGPEDVVIDYDRIAAALGPELPRGATTRHDATMVARNAILREVRRGEVKAARVWIVSANPRAEEMFPHHVVQVVDPGRDEVLRRASEGGRSAAFARIVDDWYAVRSGSAAVASREW